MNNRQMRARVLGVLGIGILCLLATGTSSDDKNSSGGARTTYIDLDATVRFTGSQFIIENNTPFDWNNVSMSVNSGLISGGYDLKVSFIRARTTYTVGAMQFAKSDGERFNPFTHKAQKFVIHCDTPRGRGSYLAEMR